MRPTKQLRTLIIPSTWLDSENGRDATDKRLNALAAEGWEVAACVSDAGDLIYTFARTADGGEE